MLKKINENLFVDLDEVASIGITTFFTEWELQIHLKGNSYGHSLDFKTEKEAQEFIITHFRSVIEKEKGKQNESI